MHYITHLVLPVSVIIMTVQYIMGSYILCEPEPDECLL